MWTFRVADISHFYPNGYRSIGDNDGKMARSTLFSFDLEKLGSKDNGYCPDGYGDSITEHTEAYYCIHGHVEVTRPRNCN